MKIGIINETHNNINIFFITEFQFKLAFTQVIHIKVMVKAIACCLRESSISVGGLKNVQC